MIIIGSQRFDRSDRDKEGRTAPNFAKPWKRESEVLSSQRPEISVVG